MKLHLRKRIEIFLFLIHTTFPSFLSAQNPGIICPGGPVEFCDFSTNDANYWNSADWWDMSISSHNLGEVDANLSIYSTAGCGNAADLQFRYILSFDLDYNGVCESFIDSDSLPAANTIFYNNKPDNLFSGTARQFDFRTVQPEMKMGFALSTEAVGDSIRAWVSWKNSTGQTAVVQMPYGAHRVQWLVTNSCGDVSDCTYNFTAKDCKKPVVVPINGLSVNVMNTNPPLIQLWASDFLQYTEDNFTPSNLLKIGIRRSGTGSGFPYNPDGTPQVGVQFNCADLGTQLVELWSIDKSGNADFAETYVLIQDNLNQCTPGPAYSGQITTEEGEGISDVTLEIAGNMPGFPIFVVTAITDELGYYNIDNSLPITPNTTITPILDIDPLNGVNTFDLILISRHILGLEPLSTPYKMISADANKSGTLTTFDVVELRKLILGTYQNLPNNKSWRFVDKYQMFSTPMNPFAETIKENITIAEAQANNLTFDFIGCKIGDVDNTATPNLQGTPEERNADLKVLNLQNRHVQAGEPVTIHFTTPEDVAGLQMTIAAKGLQLEKIIPVNNCTKDNFGLFNGIGNDNAMPAFTAAFENGSAGFDVIFIANEDGYLRNMLEISSEITKSMAFDQAGKRYTLALRFEEEHEKMNQPVFFQNSPNPWNDVTRLAFYLPETGKVNVSVTGQNGQVVYQQNGQFAAGYHQVSFEKDQFPASGVYYVRLQTGLFSEVRKMMLIK